MSLRTQYFDIRTVFGFALMIIPHLPPSVAAATTTSSVCPTCATIKKSGKMSCCALGGSWYGNCGSAALQHTWYEGVQACKARPLRTAMVQQRDAVQQNSIRTTLDTSISNTAPAHDLVRVSKAYDSGASPSDVISTATTVIFRTAVNISTRMRAIPRIISPVNRLINSPANSTITKIGHDVFMTEAYTVDTPFNTSASAPTIDRECENLVNIVVRVSMSLLIMLVVVC